LTFASLDIWWGKVGFCGATRYDAVFAGQFDHAIDGKGRVSVPVRFREVLQKAGLDRLYITNFIVSNEQCLQMYLPSDWERLVGRIKEKANFERKAQLFQIFYIGGAHEVEVDRQGRILIPPKLREFAHLEKDVTFSAMTDHFQVWDKSTLERIRGEAKESFNDLIREVGV
jgi:MraZ protein